MLTLTPTKVDIGLVFGNPETSYFLHFMIVNTNDFVLSQIGLSTGTLLSQWSYS